MVPLTHVCQYWRNSIISTPDNWTLILSERKDLAALSLERAKAAPLTIYLNMIKLRNDPGFLDLLLPHHQNIISLSVVRPATVEELTWALPNLSKSMPNLRSLTIWGPGEADWNQHIDPLDFSAAHALKDLTLHNIPLYPSILNLGTLTELSLAYNRFDFHLDTLLDFLEQNYLLESAKLCIGFAQPSLRHSQRQTPVGNRLLHLSIICAEAADGRALISNIALQRGATLEIHYDHPKETLTTMLSGVSMTHLRNLSSPTLMEYQTYRRTIRLVGPDGSFLYGNTYSLEDTFPEFPLLPLDNIREIRLKCDNPWVPEELHRLTFPSLEVLVISSTGSRHLDTTLFPDSISLSLKTLAFLNCNITESFMAALTWFASRREKHTSASLRRVVIVCSLNYQLPSEASIAKLRRHVPVVEVIEGRELPKDLSWGGSSSLPG